MLLLTIILIPYKNFKWPDFFLIIKLAKCESFRVVRQIFLLITSFLNYLKSYSGNKNTESVKNPILAITAHKIQPRGRQMDGWTDIGGTVIIMALFFDPLEP